MVYQIYICNKHILPIRKHTSLTYTINARYTQTLREYLLIGKHNALP